jgi:hypothetical protein
VGLFDFLGGKKDSGRDTGNALNMTAEQEAQAKAQLGNLLSYQADPNIVDPIKGSQTATRQVMDSPLLGQIFGEQGTMARTGKEEQDLASRGYSLKPEDYEAYGQASDQMARQFGQQESGLAAALANRGMSNSGVAGQAYSGLQGNKMERLGQMQRQIANDRMQKNMERLGQTRSFLSNLTGQAGQQVQNQFGRQMEGEKQQFGELEAKNNAALNRMGAQQKQSNEQMKQRQGSEQQQGWASVLQGVGNYAQGQDLLGSVFGGGPTDTFGEGTKMSDDGGAAKAQAGKKSSGGIDPKMLALA